MAEFEVAMTGGGDFRFRVVYTVTPVAGGVQVAVTSQWMRRSGAGAGYSGGAPYYLTIGGYGTKQGTRQFDGSLNGWQWIESTAVTFVSGTQTYITATFDTDTASAGAGSIVSLTVPIAVASLSTFSPSSALTAGAATTINTNRQSTAYTHSIYYSFGALSSQLIAESAGASVGWTPPLSLLEQIPDAVSGKGVIGTNTFNGTTGVGYTTTAFTLTAPASVVPTCSGVSAADQNSTVVSAVGKPVQGLSRLKLTVSGAGIYGSTITAATATMQGTTVNNGGEILVTGSGNIAVTGKVTDSRGRTGSWSGTVNALAYSQPGATAFQARRCSTAGAIQDDGTYLRVDLNATIASLVNTTERNLLTIRAFTRPSGGGVWTPRNVITPGGTAYSSWFLMSGGGIFATTQSYDVRVQIHDRFNTVTLETIAPTAAVALDLNGNKVGVGKIHELGALDVAGDVYANGALLLPAASSVETQAGGISNKAVTPASLAARMLIADQGPTSSYASYPMGASTMFAAPQTTGWPVSGRYGTVHTLRSYAAGGGTIQYWTSYQSGPDADRIWFRQWVYLATAWTEWQELAVRGQNGTPWAQAGGRGTSSASGAVTVTLPAGKFTQPPLVNVMPATHANVLVARLASAVTTTSFQVQLFTMPGAGLVAGNFDWTAVQMTAGSATG